MGRNRLAIVLAFSLVALQSAAVTIHRSFRTREAGFGFGTGTAGVAHPVDFRIAAATEKKLAMRVSGGMVVSPDEWRENKRKI